MKYVLSFNGSRGDAGPGVALGVALAARGNDVTMAVPPNLVAFARGAGLRAEAVGQDTKVLLDSDLVSRDMSSNNPVRKLRAISELTLRGGRAAQSDLLAIADGADAIVGSSVGQERSLNIAEKLRIPYVPVHYCPVRRNGSAAIVPLPGRIPPPWLVRTSWSVVDRALWQSSRRVENRLRADLGLTAGRGSTATRIRARAVPEIQAYDPLLFPGLADEWGSSRPLVGFLPSTATPDTDDDGVREWLDDGDPPLYVGFGSMSVPDPNTVARAIASATSDLGLRVLVAAGWHGFMANSPYARESHIGQSHIRQSRVRVVDSVDHRSVLPRCRAAVHHGGAGTTAAALRAGLPALICSFGADQPMWGRQLARIGVGDGIPIRSVTEHTLGRQLRRLLEPELAARAQEVGSRLVSGVDAMTAAVEIVESSTIETSRNGVL